MNAWLKTSPTLLFLSWCHDMDSTMDLYSTTDSTGENLEIHIGCGQTSAREYALACLLVTSLKLMLEIWASLMWSHCKFLTLLGLQRQLICSIHVHNTLFWALISWINGLSFWFFLLLFFLIYFNWASYSRLTSVEQKWICEGFKNWRVVVIFQRL